MNDKINVLFVCTGNICRSPLAEAVMRDYVQKQNLNDKFVIDSAGTSHFHVGQGVDFRSVVVARQNNIKIGHVARQLTPDDFNTYQFILVMDDMNYRQVTDLATQYASNSKVLYLRAFDPEAREGSYNMDVPDPYDGEDRGFEEVFHMCKRSVEGFVSTVQNTAF